VTVGHPPTPDHEPPHAAGDALQSEEEGDEHGTLKARAVPRDNDLEIRPASSRCARQYAEEARVSGAGVRSFCHPVFAAHGSRERPTGAPRPVM